MNSTELLEAFRSDVVDNETPPLWADVEVYRYIDEAQKMFCRLTEGIEDARTPSVTQLTVPAGTEWIDHSPLILKIRAAFRDGRPLGLVPFEGTADLFSYRSGSQGTPKALIIGESKNALRVHPAPVEDTAITLAVFRLPLKSITDAGDQNLEIDEQHHEGLLHWVKHRAYGKQDADGFDPRKAAEAEGAFRAYCAQAKREQGRARHPAGVTMYGGY